MKILSIWDFPPFCFDDSTHSIQLAWTPQACEKPFWLILSQHDATALQRGSRDVTGRLWGISGASWSFTLLLRLCICLSFSFGVQTTQYFNLNVLHPSMLSVRCFCSISNETHLHQDHTPVTHNPPERGLWVTLHFTYFTPHHGTYKSVSCTLNSTVVCVLEPMSDPIKVEWRWGSGVMSQWPLTAWTTSCLSVLAVLDFPWHMWPHRKLCDTRRIMLE